MLLIIMKDKPKIFYKMVMECFVIPYKENQFGITMGNLLMEKDKEEENKLHQKEFHMTDNLKMILSMEKVFKLS